MPCSGGRCRRAGRGSITGPGSARSLMRRILEPGQIEAFAEGAIPRLRLPDRTRLFAARAQRLRQLAAPGAPGQAIGDYLRLMAAVADAQQLALGACEPALPTATQIAQ